MKNKNLKFLIFTGAVLAASTVVQADFEIKNTDSKNVSYTIYADDYDFDYEAGTDVVNEEGLRIVVTLETTLEANTQDPFLIFYHQDDISTADVYFGNNGIVKIPSYCSGFQDEHPSEEGRISAVYYLKSPEEAGMDISMELYSPEFSTYARIEDKSGKTFLAAIQLTDKDKTSESSVLVPVINGKADKDLWWYLNEEDTDAEILGVLPLEPMSEEECEIEAEQWNLRGDVISEWSTYNSGASFAYKEPIVGISAYGCEDNGDTVYSLMDNSQWDYYNINKHLSENLISKIGTEDDKTLLEMAMNEMPKEEPTVSLYGIVVPDEVVDIPVKSAAVDSYGEIIEKASSVSISLLDGTTYDSYEAYLQAMNPETEPVSEAVEEAAIESETELASEAVEEAVTESEPASEAVEEAAAESEIETESESETEKVYTDAETIKKVQDLLRAMGYDPGVVDGKNGKRTIAAIQEFQEDEGLDVTGDITDSFLEVFLSKSETEMELNKKVQEKLTELGADLGTIDGRKGKKTVAAMNEFQKKNGLEETNKITDELLEALGIEK